MIVYFFLVEVVDVVCEWVVVFDCCVVVIVGFVVFVGEVIVLLEEEDWKLGWCV